MSLFEKPHYDSEIDLKRNMENMYSSFGRFIEQMNRERSTGNLPVIYSGTVSSGTVAVPQDIAGHSLMIAVIGGVPVIAVQYGGKIAARGGDASTAANLSATIAGTQMTFSASASLDKLIILL